MGKSSGTGRSATVFDVMKGRAGRGVLAMAVACAAGLATAQTAHSTPNTADGFYAPPTGYAETEPGTVLRSRPIAASFFQALPMAVDAWQVLYRTTDSTGAPYSAVTTVLKPRQGNGTILSFQNMTDAIAPQCMPSQALQQGQVPWLDFGESQPIELTTMANESPLVAAALAKGWTVSVPDYGGVDNHFLAPKEPGYVILDGIRAVRNLDPAAAPADSKVLMWGYSGGGIATGWAAQEQPSYAPELDVAAAALGAPVGDFEAGIRSANGTLVGGALIPVALMGMRQNSPELAAALDRYLTPAGRQKIDDATTACTPQNLLSNIGFDAARHLTVPLSEVLADPVIQAAVQESELGHTAPTAPLYVYNAIADEISTIAGADTLVAGYCDSGVPVTYRREQLPMPLSGHTLEWALGAPGALAWLQQQADAAAEPTGCDIASVPATITDPAALGALTSGIITGSVLGLFGL
ncbi:lipase family protein [Nocardia sp. NPDC005978]|uniref:lipase family protein n=1 Tax=Nocardia sp. NPDC005978 TaxID=3156725 RepID=UPI0033B8EDEA